MIFVLFRVYYYPNRQMCNKERKLVNEVLKLENLWSMGGGGRERKKTQKILALAIADKEQLNFFLKERRRRKKKKWNGEVSQVSQK